MSSQTTLLRGIALLGAMLLGGCQSSLERLQEQAQAQGWAVATLPSQPFPLVYAAPLAPPSTPRLRVYIEGDGHAWATPSQPSLDPSPRRLLVAELAFADRQPSVYLARPCQYRQPQNCRTELWTERRYAQEVVDSLDAALTGLKARYANREFELIGYSGGATLALLLAAQRTDVVQVQTLAGNLSPRHWVTLLDLTPLHGSLEPLDRRERLATVAQRHLLGSADRTIPAQLLQYYRTQLGPARCLETELLPGVGHAEGWPRAWAEWRQRPLACAP